MPCDDRLRIQPRSSFADRHDAIAFKEHVLGPGQTDAFGTELDGFLRVGWRVGVGAHVDLAQFVGPVQHLLVVARCPWVLGLEHARVDLAGAAIEREKITLLD